MKKIFNISPEPVSGLTHLVGALLSVVGLILLIVEATAIGKPLYYTAFIIFGLSMVFLYTSSSLYHLLPVSERASLWLKKLDHSMIYVLIAGTYTPVCLLLLDGGWRWGLFTAVWGLSVVGITLKIVWIDVPRWLSTVFYLLLGWLAVILLPDLWYIASPGFLIWIGIGGLAYTLGAIIYALKKPDPIPDIFGFHEIWHLFVMAGTFSHFWGIYDYLTVAG